MTCADCHPMRSLQEGQRGREDLRRLPPRPSRDVPEHAFAAHMKKMECVACHAAWAAQEYGTFLVRPKTGRAAGGLRGPSLLGPVEEERLPEAAGRAAARAERARQGRADPPAVHPLRDRSEPRLGEQAAGRGVEGLLARTRSGAAP